jgi:hypothetical protein
MTRILSAAAIAATITLLAACSGSKGTGDAPYGSGDPALGAPAPSGSVSPFLTDGQAVARALDAVATKSGQPLRVTTIGANAAGGLTVDVLKSSANGNLGRYQVMPNGTIFGPIPEKLVSGGGEVSAAQIQSRAFDPKAIAFVNLGRAERDAIAKSKLLGARVIEWDVSGLKAAERRALLLQAAGRQAVVQLDPQLNVVTIQP